MCGRSHLALVTVASSVSSNIPLSLSPRCVRNVTEKFRFRYYQTRKCGRDRNQRAETVTILFQMRASDHGFFETVILCIFKIWMKILGWRKRFSFPENLGFPIYLTEFFNVIIQYSVLMRLRNVKSIFLNSFTRTVWNKSMGKCQEKWKAIFQAPCLKTLQFTQSFPSLRLMLEWRRQLPFCRNSLEITIRIRNV